MATITTEAKDSGGVALAASHSWSFTTVGVGAIGPEGMGPEAVKIPLVGVAGNAMPPTGIV